MYTLYFYGSPDYKNRVTRKFTLQKMVLKKQKNTADFIKKALSVYTHSMTTFYLSLSAQVANSTFFHEIPGM